MPDLGTDLARLKGRWMIGGPALDRAPVDWQDAVADDRAPEVALLAIAAQAGQVAFRPRPEAALTPARALPTLALPPLPDRLRPAFRRLIEPIRTDAPVIAVLLRLMASRGWTVHPADWMPGNVDGLPSVYAPWADWKDRAEAHEVDLTEDNWDDWFPAERRLALADMRRTASADALALLQARLGDMTADHRVRLLDVLEIGLSDGDAGFLESLADDRSAKVRALATQYLARLGRSSDEGALAEELAAFFEVGSAGILRRGKVVAPTKLRTNAQKGRRTELLRTVSLPGFAAALGLSVDDLVAMWHVESDPTDDFVGMVARTGGDGAVTALADRLLASKADPPPDLGPLIDRLTPDQLAERLPQVLRKDAMDLRRSLICGAAAPGTVAEATFVAAGAVKPLVELATKHGETTGTDPRLTAGLRTLGLLADRDAATELVARFTRAGLITADAALAMLTFNAALEPGDTA